MRALLALLLRLLPALLIVFGQAVAQEGHTEAELLQRIGARASLGAAAGYIEDARCGVCHARQFESFQDVGMARSLRRPRREAAVEDFSAAAYVHAPSRQHLRLQWTEGGDLVFQRWQIDARGERVNAIEQRVDWLLGSGHRARVYLFGNAAGELFQLPLAWYAQERRWAMAPGYDRADHENLGRRVRRECLFCHNAYPEVDAGSDAAWQPAVFPRHLPEGIGCQRCHGPGAAHVTAVLGGKTVDEIRAAIVNPKRLPRSRRDDVCFQCHLQPAVSVMGLRREGRGDYSFRPGEALSDYLLHVDVEEAGRAAVDRFEINHHGYRLSQSKCHREGGLGCIDCHDPHVALKRDPRLAHVDATCAGCHSAKPHPQVASATTTGAGCVRCHMPTRRTQDVVHVRMTDHAILRHAPADALAALAEQEPRVTDVWFFDPQAAPPGAQGTAYRARSVLQAVPSPAALEALTKALQAQAPEHPAPWMDAVSAELRLGRHASAAERVEALLKRWPAHPQLHAWQGVTAIAQGRPGDAIEPLRRAIAGAPDQAEFHLNLALALEREPELEAAERSARRAVELRPNLVPAWLTLGRVQQRQLRLDAALDSFREALAWEPGNTRAWLGVIAAAAASGDQALAHRLRQQAREFASRPEMIGPEDSAAAAAQ